MLELLKILIHISKILYKKLLMNHLKIKYRILVKKINPNEFSMFVILFQ